MNTNSRTCLRQMHSFLPFLAVFLWSCTPASEISSQKTDGAAIPAFEIVYLNTHVREMSGKKVQVSGFIRAGFDGWHNLCLITTDKKLIDVENSIWINASQCKEWGDARQYKQGRGRVIGQFLATEEAAYVAGTLVSSEMSNAIIEWDR